VSVVNDLRSLEDRIIARLGELQPLVDEYHELQAAAQRLGLDVTAAKSRTRGAAGRRKPASRRVGA
jgi:hypothetical protein